MQQHAYGTHPMFIAFGNGQTHPKHIIYPDKIFRQNLRTETNSPANL